MWSHVIQKYFTYKCQNKVYFPDVILNFSEILFSLPSTLCLTGELCPLRFIGHHDMRVTHCQSSAMIFVFAQCSFCNSFSHGLMFTLASNLIPNLIIYIFCILKRCSKLIHIWWPVATGQWLGTKGNIYKM